MKFIDRLWHSSAEEAHDDLRQVYDEMVDKAERQYSKRVSEDIRFMQLSKVLDGSWDTLDMLLDAIEPLDDNRKTMLFMLMRRMICDAEITFGGGKTSNGGIPKDEDRIVNSAIDDELARCPASGPIDIGAIIVDLEQRGIYRKQLAIYHRIRKRGIVLPTTCKSTLSSSGR